MKDYLMLPLIAFVPYVALLLGLLIHEMAHAIIIMDLGHAFREISLSWQTGGACYFVYVGGKTATDAFCIGIAGGLFEGLFYALLAVGLRLRIFSIPAGVALMYAIGEGLWSASIIENAYSIMIGASWLHIVGVIIVGYTLLNEYLDRTFEYKTDKRMW